MRQEYIHCVLQIYYDASSRTKLIFKSRSTLLSEATLRGIYNYGLGILEVVWRNRDILIATPHSRTVQLDASQGNWHTHVRVRNIVSIMLDLRRLTRYVQAESPPVICPYI